MVAPGPMRRAAAKPAGTSRAVAALAVVFVLSACQSLPGDAFRLPESSLAIRDMQTRIYSAADDTAIMSASAAVLQDMGYAIDEVEYTLGVISASKRADATNRLEAFGTLTLDSLKCVITLLFACDGNHYGKIDDVQDIRLTLVAMPGYGDGGDVSVRITIQRIIWDKRGRLSEQSTISDSDVYAAMFARLSKAVFLEQEGI